MISVCIATYNGEKFIYKQIKSILCQLNKNDEVIISDDGSTDRTINIICDINDSRIKIFKNPYKIGPVFNFENAIRNSNGRYIFLADQDDIWRPERLNAVIPYMEEYDLVVTDCTIIDKNGNFLKESFFHQRNSGPGLVKNLYKNTYVGCCMSFKRKLLHRALPFPKFILMHDGWLGLIAEIYGKTFFINKQLVEYRRHNDNLSPTGVESSYSILKKNKIRIAYITALILRIIGFL